MPGSERLGVTRLGQAFPGQTLSIADTGLTLSATLASSRSGKPMVDFGMGGIPNPTFEVDASYWYQGTLDTLPARDMAQAQTGGASLNLTQGAAAANKFALLLMKATGGVEATDGIPVRPSAAYQLSVWVKILSSLTGAGTLKLGIVEWASDGSAVSGGSQWDFITQTAHDWQQERFVFTTHATAAKISVRVTFESTAGTIYLDNPELISPLGKNASKPISDAGLTLTEAVSVRSARSITGTGLTVTGDVVKPGRGVALVATGLTVTETLSVPNRGRFTTAQGLTLSQTLVPFLSPGGPLQSQPSGTKRVSAYQFEKGRLPKVGVFVDARQEGEYGDPLLRAVVYSTADAGGPGVLLATGQEVRVANGSGPGWVDLPLWHDPVTDPVSGGDARGALLAVAGSYYVGLIVGGSNALRVYQGNAEFLDVSGTDAYADGPSNPFGASSNINARLRLNVPRAFPLWAPPAKADNFYSARLPFPEAQKRFALTGPASGVRKRLASVSWHGTSLDVERGSFAVVGKDSELGDLLGHRVRVTITGRTATRRSVAVFVHNELPLLRGDISLSRRAFGALGDLGDDEVNAIVEVLA